MKKMKDFYQIYFSDPKTRISVALSVLAIAGLFFLSWKQEPELAPVDRVNASDFVPAGFSLITVDLQNRDSIDGLMGGFAIANLYTVPLDGKSKGVLVGRRLKLLRSPQNPGQFSVLVPEEQVPSLLPGPLFAVLLNRSEAGAPRTTGKSTVLSRIRSYPLEAR